MHHDSRKQRSLMKMIRRPPEHPTLPSHGPANVSSHIAGWDFLTFKTRKITTSRNLSRPDADLQAFSFAISVSGVTTLCRT